VDHDAETKVASEFPSVSVGKERLGHVLWQLAWPVVALNSLQVINTLLDRSFIGHLPRAALTAQGAAMNVLFLLFSIAVALATGSTALVSRAYGAHQREECREAARQSVALAFWSGIAFALIGALLIPWISHTILPARDQDAMREMIRYLGAYVVGLPAIYVVQALAGALRGIGNTKSPMVISGIQILLHIALNLVLIFPTRQVGGLTIPGWNLGLAGAGWALTASAWIAALGYLAYSSRTPLGACNVLRVPSLQWVKRILRIANPAAVMSVARVGSLTAFTLVLRDVSNGSAAIAAMAIGFAIESIMFMPVFGFSMAAGALVGQSLGMKQPDRANAIAWVASRFSAAVVLALIVPIFVFAQPIAVALVGDKSDVVAEAVSLIHWLCATEIGFSYAMVMIGAMQGAGDTRSPLWITLICLWGIRVPLAYVLAIPLGMGALGAWISLSVTQAMQGIVAVVVWRQGRWRNQTV